MKNFIKQLKARNEEGGLICIGLDIDFEKIPKTLFEEEKFGSFIRSTYSSISSKNAAYVVEFARRIVCATADLVCAYKINRGFFDSMGTWGAEALRDTVQMIRRIAPDVPIVMDSKRGDIGNSNKKYLEADVENLSGVNGITVNPYTGNGDSLDVFFAEEDLGVIVLCKTSNAGSEEIQNLIVDGEPLYLHVARRTYEKWNYNGNCALVAGATYPEELKMIRGVVGRMPLLIPGVGFQGGGLKEVLENGLDDENGGLAINSSRGVIYASSGPDFAEVARRKVKEMNEEVAGFIAGRLR